MVLILVRQIAQMFLLAGIGYLLFKGHKISEEGSRALGNILIYASLPAVIVNGFQIERTPEHLLGMAYSAAAIVSRCRRAASALSGRVSSSVMGRPRFFA